MNIDRGMRFSGERLDTYHLLEQDFSDPEVINTIALQVNALLENVSELNDEQKREITSNLSVLERTCFEKGLPLLAEKVRGIMDDISSQSRASAASSPANASFPKTVSSAFVPEGCQGSLKLESNLEASASAETEPPEPSTEEQEADRLAAIFIREDFTAEDAFLIRECILNLTPEDRKIIDNDFKPFEKELKAFQIARLLNERYVGDCMRQIPNSFNLSPQRAFDNYLKSDRKSLWVLMKVAKQRADKGTNQFFGYIQNHCCTDRKALVEIAKIVASQDVVIGNHNDKYGGVAHNIQKFGISDPNELVEIAKIMASLSCNLEDLVSNIQNFGIIDPKALIEIAKIAAATNGWVLACSIQNFGIVDQEELVEIAKIAGAKNGRGLAKYIQNFGIKNQKDLVEIAKVVASKIRGGIYGFTQNFGITDESSMIEIAKIVAQGEYLNFITHMERAGITNLDAMLEIGKKDIRSSTLNDPFSVSLFEIKRCASKVMSNEMVDRLMAYADLQCFEKTDSLSPNSYFPESHPGLFQEGCKTIILPHGSVTKDCFILVDKDLKKDVLKKLLAGYRPVFSSLFSGEEADRIINKINNYRSTPLALSLLDILCDRQEESSFWGVYLKLLEREGKGEERLTPHKMLPSLYPAKWISESQADLSAEKAALLAFLNYRETRESLRNNFNPLMQTFLQTAQYLDDRVELMPEQKLRLLSLVCTGSCDVLKALRLLRLLADKKDFNLINLLDGDRNSDIVVVLLSFFKTTLLEDKMIDLSSVADLEYRYMEKFGDLRVPMALEIFFTVIRKSNEQSVKSALERFVVSVLTNTFDEERYRTDINPHLKKIEDAFPDLLEKWKEICRGVRAPLEAMEEADIASTADKLRKSKETGELSTNYQDLFLCGTEVADSCQRVDGDLGRAQALLAYCLDGKNSIIAIKDGEGKPLVRSLLRLLWDDKNNKPVLFLDRVYPYFSSGERVNALVRTALEIGEKLNLDVVTYEVLAQTLPYQGRACSLGSSLPYECFDSFGGITRGKVEINFLKKITDVDLSAFSGKGLC